MNSNGFATIFDVTALNSLMYTPRTPWPCSPSSSLFTISLNSTLYNSVAIATMFATLYVITFSPRLIIMINNSQHAAKSVGSPSASNHFYSSRLSLLSHRK